MSDHRKIERNKYRNEMPVVDDGWWESILADEPKQVSNHGRGELEHESKSGKDTVTPDLKDNHLNWDVVSQYFESDRIVEVKVIGQNQGGLLVEGDGFSGFVPCSHLVERIEHEVSVKNNINLKRYLGKTIKVKVIECTPDEDRVVLSERAALAGSGKRIELFDYLQVGMQVRGFVTNITDFGVFVDLGGVEGLIHISELSWGRVSHPKQITNLGDEIQVLVLDVSEERCRVALSHKQLLPNPWENAENEFPEGRIVSGTISNVLSYGAFANLDCGVEGLIHATEIPLDSGQSPRDILTVGQQVQLRVIRVDADRQRLGFSMKLESQ